MIMTSLFSKSSLCKCFSPVHICDQHVKQAFSIFFALKSVSEKLRVRVGLVCSKKEGSGLFFHLLKSFCWFPTFSPNQRACKAAISFPEPTCPLVSTKIGADLPTRGLWERNWRSGIEAIL